MEVLTVSELETVNSHFVQTSEDSWWNPYTTHFR